MSLSAAGETGLLELDDHSPGRPDGDVEGRVGPEIRGPALTDDGAPRHEGLDLIDLGGDEERASLGPTWL
jgi:hypothetical protein